MPVPIRLAICFVLTVLIFTVRAESLPAGAAVLIDSPDVFKPAGSDAQHASMTTIDVTGQAFNRAWSVSLRQKPSSEYAVQLAAPVEQLARGEVVHLTIWARMVNTTDESNEGRVGVVLEQAGEPFNKVFSRSFGLNDQWQRFDVAAKVNVDFSKTPAQLTIRAGYYQQQIEVGGVVLRKFPADTDWKQLPNTRASYAGREPNAPWRTAAAERIEQLRKAPLTVKVVNAAGQPVAGAEVAIRQTRASYVFGCVYHVRMILGDPTPYVQRYQQLFTELFNTGVDEYAMKWPGWDDPKTREKALAALKWMEDRNIPVRGHTMVWPSWKRTPAGLKDLAGDRDALAARVNAHIADVGRTLAGRVIDWDVVNEPFNNNDLLKILGEDVMADWFRAAHAADPNARLYLNETSVPTSSPGDIRYTALYERVKRIQDAGAPIHGVGMQAHFGMTIQPPAALLSIYDRFATLGIPVRITELDIDMTDEELQADYFRDFLTASYSHPNVNGIMLWGFWEGQHWKPAAAMYRKDWSERPIAKVWRDLVLTQWRTNTTLKTGEDGSATVRAFHGDFQVTVGGQRQSVTVSPDGQTVTVRLP